MDKKYLPDLNSELDQELLRLGYTKGSMTFYRRRWNQLMAFAEDRGERNYLFQFLHRFLFFSFQTPYHYSASLDSFQFPTLSPQGDQIFWLSAFFVNDLSYSKPKTSLMFSTSWIMPSLSSTITSADFRYLSYTFSNSLGLWFVMQPHPMYICLICDFCSSDQSFAANFLQIPPHAGHPYPWLCAWHYQPALRTFTC